ncbi:hypothetical protein RsTz2092_04630 [Deferribacterales bacterium RsTz2092]
MKIFIRTAVTTEQLLKEVLGGVDGIAKGEHGKPFIPDSNICFNVSHSAGVLVLGLDTQPVGVDIEFMRQRNFADISKHYFGREITAISEFYIAWTRHEACVKLAGGSIFNYPADALNANCCTYKLNNKYILSIANYGGLGEMTFDKPLGTNYSIDFIRGCK